MADHDPIEFANGVSAKLATRSRHVCLFLGAGASRACGLPDVAGLQQAVLKALEEPDRTAFEAQLSRGNFEQAVSRLRRIAALVEGEEKVDGLTAELAAELDRRVCRAVVAALSPREHDQIPMLRLAAWAARADYHSPVEVFTVNYDLLVETGLESLGVPYFDGFVGSLRARFRTEMVEAATADERASVPNVFIRLWKLHGSINWTWERGERAEIVRLGMPVADGDAAAIYPSDSKYDESRRVPFVVLQDRLRRALHQPETLMMITGYSWADQHLNELLFDAATRRPRSELIAFCHTLIPEELAARAVTTPNLQVVTRTEAILGGVRAGWKEPGDAPDDVWTEGGLALVDFANLTAYLARSSSPVSELEGRLAELLARAASPADE